MEYQVTVIRRGEFGATHIFKMTYATEEKAQEVLQERKAHRDFIAGSVKAIDC